MEQELIDISSSVYHGIRDIRNSVLMNPVSYLKIKKMFE
jgi:hypothetical protein